MLIRAVSDKQCLEKSECLPGSFDSVIAGHIASEILRLSLNVVPSEWKGENE